MRKSRPKNRIAELRQARGMTQQELADAVGAHWITISKLERGRMGLTTEWMDALAAPLGVHARDLLPGADVPFRLSAVEKAIGRKPPKLKLPPSPPISVTIEDDDNAPFFHAGDVVQLVPLTNLTAKQRRQAEGRLAFAGATSDSAFGFLHWAGAGTYDLHWFGQIRLDRLKASRIFVVASITYQSGAFHGRPPGTLL
jgi:DNA-binding XRE family transcriptional regulator